MPKALVLGNGNILLCFDRCGQLRDFYFHYVGLENHVGHGCVHRIGIMVDGYFAWLDDPSWEVSVGYTPDTLCAEVTAMNHQQGIELKFADLVYNEKDIFLRKAEIKNNSGQARQIKIFFHQQFRIYDTSRRDTGYYDPERSIIVHYEGRRVFVIGAQKGQAHAANKQGDMRENVNTQKEKEIYAPFDEYSIGNYGIEGKEGTWKDAEDGELSKNAIEHGAVDSVLAFTQELEPGQQFDIDYWITVSKTFEESLKLHDSVLKKTPAYIRESTQDFWHAWIGKSKIDFGDLDRRIIDFYKKSLFIVRTHTGNQGEIIASGDSDMLQYGKDTYAYVWPRDAAFVALALDKAGYSYITRHFFEFCNQAISEDGYFYHKYRSDKSVGSSWHPWVHEGKKRLAIQEDETALIVYSLWQHYQSNNDLEFIEEIYNSLIKKAAEFMVHYRNRKTGLPDASYDLWEQDFSISTFTCSTVYGGLMAACKFAALLGKEKDSQRYKQAAAEIREATIKYLYDKKSKFFYKALQEKGGDITYDKRIDMSSFFGIFYFNVLDKDDRLLQDAYYVMKRRLWCPTPVGGIMRYEGDEFHRVGEYAPANPWFITTLWKAQYDIASARNLEQLSEMQDLLHWTIKYATEAGILSEQVTSDTGKQVSAAPLTWSHAEFISTVLAYVQRYKQLKNGK